MDFHNFYPIYFFKVKESTADIPTELLCLNDLENPSKLPVRKVLMILSYKLLKFSDYSCFRGQGPSSVPVSSIFAALNPSVESSVPMSGVGFCDNQNGLLQLHSGSISSVVNRSTATGPECSRQTHHWHWNTRAHHSSASESALAPS